MERDKISKFVKKMQSIHNLSATTDLIQKFLKSV
jgi:hypothetical protein